MPIQVNAETPAHGHLFVARGKIGHVVADAAIIPTDNVFKVERGWFDVLEVKDLQQAREHEPPDWTSVGWGASAKPKTTALWFLDVTASKLGGHDQFARLDELLHAIAEARLTPKAEGRPIPLIVMPVIGTAGGGYRHQRGKVIRRLLDACGTFVADHSLDIAIMAASPAPYSALQQRRRETARRYFPSVDLASASVLGNRAYNGSLALFLGAGTSVPAGAPTWSQLLEKLMSGTKLLEEKLGGFDKLTPLDQARAGPPGTAR